MKKDSFRIKLRAKYPENNIDRTYEIILDKGLFNTYIVLIGFGRYNTRGKQISHCFSSCEEAHVFINKKLKKRFTAKNRIGCNYEIVP